MALLLYGFSCGFVAWRRPFDVCPGFSTWAIAGVVSPSFVAYFAVGLALKILMVKS
jgi:hypothetical protein